MSQEYDEVNNLSINAPTWLSGEASLGQLPQQQERSAGAPPLAFGVLGGSHMLGGIGVLTPWGSPELKHRGQIRLDQLLMNHMAIIGPPRSQVVCAVGQEALGSNTAQDMDGLSKALK